MSTYLKKAAIFFAVLVFLTSCTKDVDNTSVNKEDNQNSVVSVDKSQKDENQSQKGNNNEKNTEDSKNNAQGPEEANSSSGLQDNNDSSNEDNNTGENSGDESLNNEELKNEHSEGENVKSEDLKEDGRQEDEQVIKLRSITRDEAGLISVEKADFSTHELNERIMELLNYPEVYNDDDYVKGLVQDSNCLIMSERYENTIMDDIKIGSNLDAVQNTLGSPGFSTDDFIFYKTDDYYLGFKGESSVELAIMQKIPDEYENDILKHIIEELNKADYYGLQLALESNFKVSEFFGMSGHIHGGGWYAESNNGIAVVEFDSNDITIYNNFEGDLYKYDGMDGNFEIVFENKDYIVESLKTALRHYININERFENEGILSPSGRLKSIFDWYYSMSHYFTIRTLDNSRPDYTVNAPAGDYLWLNDEFMLYLNAWSSIPFILKVSADFYDHTNVLYNVGILDEDDYSKYIGDYNFKIAEVNNNSFVIEDTENKTSYTIYYRVEEDGIIILSLNEDMKMDRSREIKERDLKFGDIVLGMPYEKLSSVLDKEPVEITENDDIEGMTKILRYEDGTVITVFDYSVYSVSVMSADYITPRGLKVGDSAEKLVVLYGKPSSRHDSVWIYEGFGGYDVFHVDVKNGKVKSIKINIIM